MVVNGLEGRLQALQAGVNASDGSRVAQCLRRPENRLGASDMPQIAHGAEQGPKKPACVILSTAWGQTAGPASRETASLCSGALDVRQGERALLRQLPSNGYGDLGLIVA
jgi:hypothetical protein